MPNCYTLLSFLLFLLRFVAHSVFFPPIAPEENVWRYDTLHRFYELDDTKLIV